MDCRVVVNHDRISEMSSQNSLLTSGDFCLVLV